MTERYFPRWRLVQTRTEATVVQPDERLNGPQNIAMGAQHVVAMFGSTILAPLLMGFDPNVAVLMSGVGTLIFFLLVGGRVPSYLGSSFAFIGGVIAVTGYSGSGPNPNIEVALVAIVVCGLLYTLIGLLIWWIGARQGEGASWIDKLMPPIVTGAIVAIIGLNLAPIAVKGAMGGSNFDTLMSLMTILCVMGMGVFARGTPQRLLVLLGLLLAYALYWVFANVLGLGQAIDFSGVARAGWLGLPSFTLAFSGDNLWHAVDVSAIAVIAPVVLVLVAENLGHIKAVSAMTGRNLDPYLGRAFVGDGLATMVAGSVGGTGVTTYAENIGVMAVTRIYSSLVFVVAACFAILLGFSPKFGALIQTIPGPVLGGMAVVVFGLITIAGARIWVVNQVDFSDNRNLLVAAVAMVLGAGNFSVQFGVFRLDGIGTATFGAIILYALLGLRRSKS